MPKFVSYVRVSTAQQGKSGLGLEAQQQAVTQHVGDSPILAEFVEVESGKSATNRPQLTAALDLCRKAKAKLVIAKLDRLSRDVHFISGLLKSGVEFVACDNPHANKMTVQMLAVFAEFERDLISTRTKQALAAAKARGVQLGNPNWKPALAAALEAKYPNPIPAKVVEMMRRLRDEGRTLRAIAAELNGLGLRTAASPRYPEGCIWHACTVRAALMTAAPELAAAA